MAPRALPGPDPIVEVAPEQRRASRTTRTKSSSRWRRRSSPRSPLPDESDRRGGPRPPERPPRSRARGHRRGGGPEVRPRRRSRAGHRRGRARPARARPAARGHRRGRRPRSLPTRAGASRGELEVAPEERRATARRGHGGGGALRVTLDLRARSAPGGGGSGPAATTTPQSTAPACSTSSGRTASSTVGEPARPVRRRHVRAVDARLPSGHARSPGAELAARCLLRLLDGFEGRQLATYGLTGVPLAPGLRPPRRRPLPGGARPQGAQAARLAQADRGRLDLAEPVVMVDDSISSGRSMLACADGWRPPGSRWRAGSASCGSTSTGASPDDRAGLPDGGRVRHPRGLHAAHGRRGAIPLNPTKDFPELRPRPERAADGLHPAELARQAIAEYLRTGLMLQPRAGSTASTTPPVGAGSACGGGTTSTTGWPATATGISRARPGGAARGRRGPRRGGDRRELKAARQDPLADARRVGHGGHVVLGAGGVHGRRARQRPVRHRGAQPERPGPWAAGCRGCPASSTSGSSSPTPGGTRGAAPRALPLYRHDVQKVVEPGAAWQPTGTPVAPAAPAGVGPAYAALVERAHAWVLHALGRGPEPAPPATDSDWRLPRGALVFVTVYADGRIAGCTGGPLDDPDQDLAEYAAAAVLRRPLQAAGRRRSDRDERGRARQPAGDGAGRSRLGGPADQVRPSRPSRSTRATGTGSCSPRWR